MEIKNSNFLMSNQYIHSASAAAIAGQLGVLSAKESFGTYTPEKIVKSQRSQEIIKPELLKPKFLEMISGISSAKINLTQGIDKISTNINNSQLSNFRGEIGINTPLGNSAIYNNGGRTGASLNIIA